MYNNSDILKEAKKIFFDYLGNSFLMQHDGIEQEYRSFGISKVQESIWFGELKTELVSRVFIGDYSAIGKLELMGAQDVLPEILTVSLEGDSWTKLRFAEDLWSLTEIKTNHPAEPALIRQAREKAIEIWRDLSRTATNPTVPENIMRVAAKGRSASVYFHDRLKSDLEKALE